MTRFSLRFLTLTAFAALLSAISVAQSQSRLHTIMASQPYTDPATGVSSMRVSDSVVCKYADPNTTRIGELLRYLINMSTGIPEAIHETRIQYTALGDTSLVEVSLATISGGTGPFPLEEIAFTYDAAGTLSSRTRKLPSPGGKLENRSRETYRVHPSGERETLKEWWEPSSRAWLPSQRTIHTLNRRGRVIRELKQSWMPDLGGWRTLDSIITSYNSNDTTQLLRVTTSMFLHGPIWALNELRTLNTNAAGNVLDAYYYEYDFVAQRFANARTHIASRYSAAGKLDSTGYYELDTTGNPRFSSLHAYEWNGPRQQLSRHRFINNRADGRWITSSQVDFRYEVNATGLLEPVSPRPLTVFPNPACNELNIALGADFKSSADLRILDMQGRLIRSVHTAAKAGASSVAVNLDGIPAGQYLLQMSDANGIVAGGKFTVQR